MNTNTSVVNAQTYVDHSRVLLLQLARDIVHNARNGGSYNASDVVAEAEKLLAFATQRIDHSYT